MKNANKKGMTLVEVIISMCILGAIAAMFVSIAVAAKNQNRDNYIRQREMYHQAAAAESYNPDVDYGMNVKVRKLDTKGTDNNVKMSAPFTGYNIEAEAYGYYAIRADKDRKDTNYNLRFFRSEDAEIGPNVDDGEYWFTVYNHSGADLELFFSTPETGGGRYFDEDKTSIGGEFPTLLKDKGRVKFGLVAGTAAEVFGISNNEGLFTGSHVPSGWDKIYSVADFLALRDTDESGNATNYITLHICEDGVIRNQAAYDAYKGG